MAAVLLSAGSLAIVAQAAPSTCFGEPVTIVGHHGQDRINGTPGPDVIFSRWDGQELHGLGGDDLLCGHASMHGGRGDDRMSVRGEKAFLDMSELHGGPGDDEIHRHEVRADDAHFALLTFGGAGDDRLYGGPNLDEIDGGPGNDRIYGRRMHDRLAGRRGDDVLVGGGVGDTLYGNSGNDRLRGERGGDHISGGAGNDLARGGRGDEFILGGSGLDVAYGGVGFDRCRAEESTCEDK